MVHPPLRPAPQKLVIKDLRQGKGPALPPISHKPRVTMTLLYKAVDPKTGKVFEEREDPHDPSKIEYGPGLSEGWEKGLAGMRVGGRRKLIVPARMMFEGPAAVYVIDLLSMKKNGTKIYARELRQGLRMSKGEIAKLPKLTIPRQGTRPARHIKVIDLRKGSGATLASGDSFDIRFFDVPYGVALRGSRSGRYGPVTYHPEEAVKGLAVGLLGMKVGGRRELILPPKLVFPRWKPSWGYTRFTDVYVVDLLGIERG